MNNILKKRPIRPMISQGPITFKISRAKIPKIHETNECTVRSKYFCGQPVMDESLSDFQEKKQTQNGPKKSEKPAIAKKSKPKKPIKKIKGQKDIRTVINKKNELIKYSKDFDKVCRQSGLDVDSEQLQLAIALSKSLQQTVTSEGECSSSLTTQDRQVKIRTTLQEYGFKVPEIKISVPKTKRNKSRLHYKLITATDCEKKQIISDKYAQVLFETESNKKSVKEIENLIPETSLFGKATTVSYETIKSNDIYYVDNLIEKNNNSIGSLLRDWTEIPGRPSSPVVEHFKINFDDIEVTSHELDCVLSGTLEVAQNIIRNKYIVNEKDCVNNIHETENLEADTKMDPKGLIIVDDEIKEQSNFSKVRRNNDLTVTKPIRSCSPDIFDDDVTVIDDSYNTTGENYKTFQNFICDKTNLSGSGDEIQNETVKTVVNLLNPQNKIKSNDVIDITEDKAENKSQKPNITKRKSDDFMKMTDVIGNAISQKSLGSNFTKRKTNDFMEMTEFIDGNILSQNSQSINRTKRKSNDLMEITDVIGDPILSQKSQEFNFTKRKSDDFMEITKYHGGTILSQQSQNFINTALINDINAESTKETTNITQEKTTDVMEITECVGITSCKEAVKDKVDLTQMSPCEQDNEYVHEKGKVDLTQSSNSSDDTLPFVNVGGKNTPLEVTTITSGVNIIVNEDRQTIGAKNDLTPSVNCYTSSLEKIYSSQTCHENKYLSIVVDEIDTDKCSNLEAYDKVDLSSPELTNSNTKSKTESFFEEFSYQHSENSSKEKDTSKNSEETPFESADNSKVSECSVDLTQTYETPVKVDLNGDIDLTQSTDSSMNIDEQESPQVNYEQLGKIDNVSVDYDEVYVNRDISCNSVDYDDLFDNVIDSYNPSSSKSNYYSRQEDFNHEAKVKSSNNDFRLSQNSEVFEISDNELNYSIQKSKQDNFDIGGISVINNMSSIRRSKSVSDINNVNTDDLENSFLPEVHIKGSKDTDKVDDKDSYNYSNSQPTLSKNKSLAKKLKEINKTPLDQKYIMKIDDVTPMADYTSLTTPQITKELNRYGIKPLKRRRAVQLLTHIYHQTHPTIESCSDDYVSPSKKLKTHHIENVVPSVNDATSPKKSKKISPRKLPLPSANREELPTQDKENCIYEVTSETPVIKDLESSDEDWVFQKREKAKIQSCRVPLHIALHNYVSARLRLREAILRYEPVNIDVIHKGLVANGFRYDPKDLLKYMDKKCITVKTADSNVKNRKHY